MSKGKPTTRISHHTTDAIVVRGHDLVSELIGNITFTEMMFLQLTGQKPTRSQTILLDAVLVTLMEHGLTPSVIVARLVYDSAPEALQSAVAAGLCAVASKFVGTMEGAAALLDDIVAAGDGVEMRAREIAERHRDARQPVPGFGHPLHRPDDPRTPRLIALAEQQQVKGDHIRALRALAAAVDAAYARHLTINATGAVAAVLREIGLPRRILRGIAVVSRSAGLVGHLHEEQATPTGDYIWNLVMHAVPYDRER